MKCPRHPRVSLDPGECWFCAGRPPNWKCSTCGRKLPCDHIREAPALTKASAMTKADLMRAIECYRVGTCDWAYVESCIDRHEVEVRTSWSRRESEEN